MKKIIEKLARPALAGLTPYRPGKPLDVLAREKGISRAIKIASNENPRPAPESARKAIMETTASLNRYPEGSGLNLREDLASFYGLDPGEIILGSGSSEVLAMVLQSFLNPGEEVLMPEPGFLIYPVLTLVCGGLPVRVPLADDFSYRLERFAKKLTGKTRFVFLCSPNNPSGTIIRKKDLRGFAGDLPEETILVLDEAYAEYAESPEFGTGLEFFRERPVLVTRTFSKIYALAGLRIGYGIADASMIEQLNRIRPPFNTTSPAQAAARAVLKDTEYRQASLSVNREGKKFLCRELDRLGVSHVPTEANFILLDFGAGAPGICRRMEDEGVIIRPVENREMKERYVRVTIGTAEENALFIEALQKIRQAGQA